MGTGRRELWKKEDGECMGIGNWEKRMLQKNFFEALS